MDSHSTFGKEPKLRSLPEIPNWINNIMGYCSSLNLSSLLLSNWSVPENLSEIVLRRMPPEQSDNPNSRKTKGAME